MLNGEQREHKNMLDRERQRRNREAARQQQAPAPKAPRVILPFPSRAVPDLSGAACLGQDPDLWFSHDPADIDQAMTVCISCPVRVRCLRGADDRREMFGVWGGIDFDRTHQEAAS